MEWFIFLLKRTDVEAMDAQQWEFYDSAVVIARNVAEAKQWARSSFCTFDSHQWTTDDNVHVECLGKADGTSPRLVCASYNAG